MFKKHIFAKFYAAILLFAVNPLFAGALPDNIDFNTKLNLFAAKANTSNTFLPEYKVNYLKLDIDLTYHITEDFSFNLLPYAWTSYYVNRTDRTQTQAKP